MGDPIYLKKLLSFLLHLGSTFYLGNVLGRRLSSQTPN